MTCLAVTRGGYGEVWFFKNKTSADEHPLIQYGDAIVGSEDELTEHWPPHRWGRLARVARSTKLEADLRVYSGDVTRFCRDLRHEMWQALTEVARHPPEDPSEICRLVTEDRKLYARWHDAEGSRKVTSMATAQTTETKTKAEAKEKTIAGHPTNAKISFGSHPEKGDYHPTKNNPKRAGSKSHSTFALYKSGMTLQKAIEAGVSAADIKWDIEHGFISVE